MKFYVDELPKEPKDCPFATNSTGLFRCRNTARICPVGRGEPCPFMTTQSPEPKKTGRSAKNK